MRANLPENIWNSPVIRKRLLNEAGFECNHGLPSKEHYWFLVPSVDNVRDMVEIKNFEPGIMDIEPHPAQMEFARIVQNELQRDAHHDGLWIVGWTHPPSSFDAIRQDGDNAWYRLCMIWLDEDADPQYTLESDFPFFDMVDNGAEYYVNLAQEAHQEWVNEYGAKSLKGDMGLKEDQTTKAALASLR